MTEPKTNRIPAPVYAAAGAGELAIEQLRKLPATVSDLGTRVVADLGGKAVVTGFELREKANETLRTANALREKAAAGDLDLNQLRAAATRNAAADLNRLREAVDPEKLRAAATRNAAAVLAGAQVAQERALAAYDALVARGERVVGAGVPEAADTVNTDIEATGAGTGPARADAQPAEAAATETTAPAEVPSPTEVAKLVEEKPLAVRAKTGDAPARKPRTKAAKPAETPSGKLPRATKRTRPAAE
ncbi:hypothetical protein D7147_21370 [Micromonospora musae]|uniref:Uncharacterized protein n=1 Tax=Micromonospora musae TaxID=1894970 RepID=A0A3A9Y1I0_9ACTN|nr:hypothetical protein [Micromonospora musae]RKN17198.1 hypothetical protein D7147_21370 [Micromonospora musae]RKN31129.1 hypothetical protein D7044_17930 [Micromonospora musae]